MADASPDDLDQLLDSVLDDFAKLDLALAERIGDDRPSGAASPSVQGLGMGLPDLKAKRKGKQRAAPPRGSHASDALEQLTRQTREAVRGMESATAAAASPRGKAGVEGEAMVEDFIKQFEELAGSPVLILSVSCSVVDMESIVQTMMQQLLSKEILHEPMKEIGERYPKWLEEHKDGLKPEEYNRYYHQYELILELNEVYEKDPNNFSKIVDLMQKMQECGQPPNDLVQELAPDLDLSQLPLELLDPNSNCCIM